jgi:membrane-bound ClpP family serine protease
MDKRFTLTRLVLAIVSMALEQVAIFAVWYWLLPAFDIHLHVGVVIGVMMGWGIFGTWLFIFTTGILKKRQQIGQTSMVSATGIAAGKLSPEGMVRIHGELWGAISEDGDILPEEEIIVTGEKGLKLLVRKKPKR